MRCIVGCLILFAACGDDSSQFVDTGPPDYVWYVLDETSGTTAHDSSPNHYDITDLTGVTWSAGASFDGTGGGGSIAVDASYRKAPITITAWATPTSRADQRANTHGMQPFPSSILGDDGYGIGLDVWSDGTPGAALIGEGVGTCTSGMVDCAAPQILQSTPVTFVAGTEYFLAMAVGADHSAYVYVDGELFDNTSATALSGGATTLSLGTYGDDSAYATKRFFAGAIRDARVYKRQLSAGEVAGLHRAGPTLLAP